MIITRTPFRISLFGGGTDHPAWFREHGGEVVGFAINKYCYISLRYLPPFFDHRFRIIWSKVESVNAIDEIQHPAVRGILRHLQVSDGLEIHHDADLPARSGIGSSSSFTVGLLSAIYALRRRFVDATDLAREAIFVEQEVLKESVGCQDQVWAAFGGMNHIRFDPSGTFSVKPLIMTAERQRELMRSVLMVFTGLTRFSSDFAASQIRNIPKRTPQLSDLQQVASRGARILQDPSVPLAEVGSLLHDAWRLKRELSDDVSSGQIDTIYEEARAAGAWGGKILGAGGGGFMLLLADPSRHAAIRARLAGLVTVPVDVDADGSKVIVFQPNDPQPAIP
jgi:D-glycero-alpha-D-manno-heptose-7-phosphate kinase